MQFLLAMALPFLACFFLAGICSALWWKSLEAPWQFFALAVLLLLGLHRVIKALAETVKFLRADLGGYFLEARPRPSFHYIVQEQLSMEAIAVTVVLVVAGIPLLFWLRNALPKI